MSSPSAFPSLPLIKSRRRCSPGAGAAAPSASPPVARADARSRWRAPPWTSCPTTSWKTRSRTTMPMRHQRPSRSSREKALTSHLTSTYHPQPREEIFRPSPLPGDPLTWPLSPISGQNYCLQLAHSMKEAHHTADFGPDLSRHQHYYLAP